MVPRTASTARRATPEKIPIIPNGQWFSASAPATDPRPPLPGLIAERGCDDDL
jgi:hypothetical protein